MSDRSVAAASAGRVNRWIALCTVLSFLVLAGIPSASYAHGNSNKHKFEVKVFGDSLSDTGNALVLGAPLTFRPFDGLVPDGPYWTWRFTNGPNWVDRLTARLGTRSSGKAALLFPGKGGNYAVGGARARLVGSSYDLPLQVECFLASGCGDSENKLRPKDQVWIQFGGNDIRDAIAAYGIGGDATAGQILCDAVASIEANIVRLYLEADARKFFVLNGPDLGVTPEVWRLEQELPAPGLRILATTLSQQFNLLLVLGDLTGTCATLGVVGIQGVVSLESSLPQSEIVVFDVFGLLNEVVDDPEAFGLSNATDPCITPGVIKGAVCTKPWKFVFWDGIHPTAAMHRIVARRAFYQLLFASLGSAEQDAKDKHEKTEIHRVPSR